MEEQKEVKKDWVTHPERLKTAQFFSNIAREGGFTGFVIKYVVTEGNLDIDKQFQEFCFKHTNNEYLQGIKLLLETWEHYKDLQSIQSYMEDIESRLLVLEEKFGEPTVPIDEKKEKQKVF